MAQSVSDVLPAVNVKAARVENPDAVEDVIPTRSSSKNIEEQLAYKRKYN